MPVTGIYNIAIVKIETQIKAKFQTALVKQGGRSYEFIPKRVHKK